MDCDSTPPDDIVSLRVAPTARIYGVAMDLLNRVFVPPFELCETKNKQHFSIPFHVEEELIKKVPDKYTFQCLFGAKFN